MEAVVSAVRVEVVAVAGAAEVEFYPMPAAAGLAATAPVVVTVHVDIDLRMEKLAPEVAEIAAEAADASEEVIGGDKAPERLRTEGVIEYEAEVGRVAWILEPAAGGGEQNHI